MVCPACSGSGIVYDPPGTMNPIGRWTCDACHGTGRTTKARLFWDSVIGIVGLVFLGLPLTIFITGFMYRYRFIEDHLLLFYPLSIILGIVLLCTVIFKERNGRPSALVNR